MKVTIDGSKEEIKEALQAIAGSSKHLEFAHGFSSVTPKPEKISESENFDKKISDAISPNDQAPLQ